MSEATRKFVMNAKQTSAHCFVWILISISVFFSTPLSAQVYSVRQTQQQVPDGFETKFWAYVPEDYPEAANYPLLISLHGGSAIGDNLSLLLEPAHENPAYLISADKWFDLPFIVISPQMKLQPEFSNGPDFNEQNWNPDQIDELIDYVVENYKVDENRIYITGISLGAAGTWNYGVAYPDRVAAILPVGGKAPKGEACAVKDVPIWAFHGENDFLVFSRFTTDMVEAIKDCSPSGKYIPHANVAYSMEHPVWNEVYNMTGGYDVYKWLLSFNKSDLSNKKPFVFTGLDKKMLKPASHFYLTAEYFDSDGQIVNVQWSQVSNGSPSLTLENTSGKFLKINTTTATAGLDYVFRLTVTDNIGAVSFDDVKVRLLAANETRAVTSISLTSQTGSTSFGALANDMEFDLGVTGKKINLLATAIGSGVRVKWGINTDQHTRNSSSPFYVKSTTAGATNSGWTVTKGEYLVCATAYANDAGALGQEYTSLCYKIKLIDDVSVQKYYAIAGSNISQLSSWKSNEDGSGTSPSSFSAPNQFFIVSKTATLDDPLDVGSNSKLIVSTNGSLTIADSFTGTFVIEGKGYVKILDSGNVPAFEQVSRTSSVEFNGSAARTIPLGDFGHLLLKGTGNKNFTNGTTFVRGNLIAESMIVNTNSSGVPNLNGGVAIVVSGNATFSTATTFPFILRFIEGFGNQHLNIPGDYQVRNLFIEKGITVNVNSPTQSTITIGSGTGGGTLEIHTFGLLKLNGNNLRLINTAAINVPSFNAGTGVWTYRLGKVELANSIFTVSTASPGTALNLYPAPGKNQLKILDVTLPAAHEGFNLKDSLSITQSVKITNGKINSNGLLTLKSTPTSTAYVAPVVSPGSIVGNVNLERMVKPGKVYRYLSFPVKNFTVQKLQQFIPVSGAFTGASPGYSASPSMYVYSDPLPIHDWVPYPAANETNAKPLEVGKGYAVYIREASQQKKMVLTGELHIGNFDYASRLTNNPTNVDTLGWNLIGNPYAAPIKWGATGWTRVQVDPGVYIRDNNAKGFRFYDGGPLGNLPGGIIPTGQAFYVRTSGNAPSLLIGESAKDPALSPELYRENEEEIVSLQIDLSRNGEEDNTFIKFIPEGEPTWKKGYDLVKMKNDFFNVSILSSDNHSLAIKNLCDTLCSQETGLLVAPAGAGNYTLRVQGNAFDYLVHALYIRDNFLGTTSELKENVDYVFEVNAAPESYARNRFTLIIEKSNVLQPVITLQDGYLVSSVTADVQWMFNGEDIGGANGQTYLPLEDGEYSVRTVGKSCSKVSESFNYRVTDVEHAAGSIKLFPNPAVNHLRLSGLTPGKENVHYSIITLSGSTVQSGELSISATGEAEIRLRPIFSGLYLLKLIDGKVYQFKFSVQ